jgi:sodium transport system permease protein
MAKTTRRSGLIAIIKKEFTRFFTDKRMVLTALLLPGLMIYLMYSFMGNALENMLNVDEDYVPTIYAVNLPTSIQDVFEAGDIATTSASAEEAAGIKEQITNKEADILLVFPEDFDTTLEERTTLEPAQYIPPGVQIYYNSTRIESGTTYGVITQLLDAYKTALTPSFDINNDPAVKFDLVTERDETGFTFASMLPMLIIIFLYSGCMSIAPESIAGEKERGTMATMLITPLARWELALGKVISLGFISLLSGLSSFIGIMLSLPAMMESGGSSNNALIYGLGDYAILLGVTLSTVLVFISLISIISAYARTVKEANSLMMPLMIVVMLVGILGMFSTGAVQDLWYYLIPVYNSVQCLIGVFSFTAAPLFVTVTIIVNLVVSGICIVALTKMFNSEKILFGR